MVGQYNSAFALVKQLALAVGPAVGGPMGAALHGPYIVTFVLFSLGDHRRWRCGSASS